jgi:hypothetical protein
MKGYITLVLTMNNADVVALVNSHCQQVARQYGQDKDEFFSYALARLPGLLSRIDQKGYTPSQCVSYIKKSVRGYCLHYIRDESNIIKTPRSSKPYSNQPLLDTDPIYVDQVTPSLPWYIEEIMADPTLNKRISNSYLRFLDT